MLPLGQATSIVSTTPAGGLSDVEHADDLLKEYLMFRGFMDTYRSFEAERRADRLQTFHADKVCAGEGRIYASGARARARVAVDGN